MAVESAVAKASTTAAAPATALFPSELESYAFDLNALRQWMITLVVADFNVDVGVEVEYMFPEAALSKADIETICFSSFPEKSNSDTLGETAFHFKFRHTSPSVFYTPSDHDPDHWYGYCLFRQEYDVTAKRNYRQKSLILLSQHYFPPLFSHIVRTVSMLEFAVSPALIESACSNIASWGPPEIGIKELPFLGEILEVHIPPHHAFPLQGLVRKDSVADLRVHYTEIHTSGPVGSWARLAHLLTSLSELYVIFERALLSEPLVVLAVDPRDASEFVSAVVDMIRPIPFAGDSRPFFPMQSDFPSDSRDPLSLRHYLIGITNPFFLKRLLSQGNESSIAHVVYLAGPETRRKTHLLSYYTSSATSTNPDWDYPAHMIPANPDPKTFIQKDPIFLRKLEVMLRDPTASAQDCERFVRRHFALLSALFLAPLNRYLATLASSSPDSNIIDMANFSEDDFLASLAKYGCSVNFKGKTSFHRHKTAEAFYKKFCRSPSFFTWLEMKMRLQSDPSAAVGEEKDE